MVDEMSDIRIVTTYWKAGQSHLNMYAELLCNQHPFYESPFSVGLYNKGNKLMTYKDSG